MKKESKFDLVSSFIQWCLIVALVALLVLNGSLPVHAAESWSLVSNAGEYKFHQITLNTKKDKVEYDYYITANLSDTSYFYAVCIDSDGNEHRVYRYKLNSDSSPDWNFPQNTFKREFSIFGGFESSNVDYMKSYIWCNSEASGELVSTVDNPLPLFNSVDSMKNYCLTGDTSGLVSGGSIDNPDFQDTAYAFTGFTANSKMTATWTGTTERSYLKDEDVEEYVRVSYGFAAKDAPDSIKQVDNDSKEYSTAAKSLTVKVSDLVPDDDSWFLRYVQVIPCYRQAGLGAWGDFYHGESSYVYFNADGSIDKIVAPYVKGSLSADMERPVIVLHEAANGNPTESDYSYFEFNNAREDYFFEMKGRWYTTNDFDIYRDKLVWKYKYSTLLKNDLSTWVTVADGKNSVGKFQFDILGKSSWENLITSYPVDDRNYIGGSYALVNKITGYSDAVDTLKMLLKQPYSLYNGYEVYVRYYRYDENGSIEYSKWTHFYNNLANSEGSSGSRLDDLDNMYSENQSDKGLTDDELSDLENTGNSRNDLDAVPKNNYDYSSLETATMNFFDLLTNYGSMLGQFPSMVTAVFDFLPAWLIGLIAVAIGAVIVCRFIGR